MSARDRLPPLADAELTDAQRAAAARLIASPRGALRGPFVPLLRSPELLDRAQALGEFLRYRCSIPVRQREFAILVTAQHWRQEYEWQVHAPLAAAAGVAEVALLELARGRQPAALGDELQTIYDFCTELHRGFQVSDGTWRRAVQQLGEAGAVELCGICGYYALLAMVLNVARTAPPAGGPPVFGAD